MIPRRARAAPCLVAAFLLGSCAATAPTYEFAEDFERDYRDLETTLAVEPDTLAPGGTARLRLTISNVGAGTARLRFPERRQIGLAVFDAAGRLYHTDVRTVRIPQDLVLGPLEKWTRTIEWDGAIEIGRRREPLVPGRWELQAGIRRAGDVFVNRSNRVTVRITAP